MSLKWAAGCQGGGGVGGEPELEDGVGSAEGGGRRADVVVSPLLGRVPGNAGDRAMVAVPKLSRQVRETVILLTSPLHPY